MDHPTKGSTPTRQNPCLSMLLVLVLVLPALAACSSLLQYGTFAVPTPEQLIPRLESVDPEFAKMKQARKTQAAQAMIDELFMNPVYAQCGNELNQHCSGVDSRSMCLVAQKKNLGQCCLSAFHSQFGNGLLSEQTNHHGVTLPRGTRMWFAEACVRSFAVTDRKIQHKDVSLAPGQISFNEKGWIEEAPLAAGRLPNGAQVRQSAKPVRFHRSGLPQYADLDRPYADGKLVFHPYENSTVFDSQGRVLRGMIKESVLIEEHYYAAGILVRNSQGKVREATTASKQRIGMYEIPAGSRVEFGDSNLLKTVTLPVSDPSRLYILDQHLIGGFWFRPHQKVEFEEGIISALSLVHYHYQDGVLYPPGTFLTLARDGSVLEDSWTPGIEEMKARFERGQYDETPEINERTRMYDGLSIPPGAHLHYKNRETVIEIAFPKPFEYNGILLGPGKVTLHRDSSGIQDAPLAESQRIDGVHYGPAGTPVGFWFTGKLISGVLDHDQFIGGLPLKAHTFVRYAPQGQLQAGTLANAATVVTTPLPAGTEFRILTGTLIEATPSVTARLNGVTFGPERMRFHPNGAVKSGRLEHPTAIGTLSIDSGDVSFWPGGEFRSGLLLESAVFDGQSYPKGTDVFVDHKGHLIDSRYRPKRPPTNRMVLYVDPEVVPWVDPLPRETCALLEETDYEGFSAGSAGDARQACSRY